jgi:hypothetical protein
MAKRISTAVILALAAALGLFSDLGLNRAVLQGPRICPHDAEQVYVPAGPFLMGSTREEREYAYELDKGITRSYGWYEKETRRKVATGPFCIDRYPVTNAAYKGFVKATGHPAPFISADGYRRQGFLAHSYDKVQEFLWKDGLFPAGRDSHPVALVSLNDAQTYCDWRGTQMRRRYRLPSEEEWERPLAEATAAFFPGATDGIRTISTAAAASAPLRRSTAFPKAKVPTVFTTWREISSSGRRHLGMERVSSSRDARGTISPAPAAPPCATDARRVPNIS